MSDLFDLTGKKALVVGGAQGIGNAIARGFAMHGAEVVIADIKVDKAIEEAEKIKKTGHVAKGYKIDVTRKDDVIKTIDTIYEENGRIDILVNSAGIVIRKLALDLTEEDWDKIQAVNLKGTFLTCQAVGKYMIKQQKGKVINIASVSARLGHTERAAYAASKGGVAQLTKVLAHEWAKYNVNVNAICPTIIQTSLNEALWGDPVRKQKEIEQIPLGRLGVPEDIVGSAVFLAAKASDFVTGHLLFVDGGRTID
jgi:NAD(P)-dependent dehydrogenase (short-subunit alcohol dehydrogenase family)